VNLKPFFLYYGGKWRAAPRYPAPIHDTIIEPFAGAAGYSLRYSDRRIILVDKYEVICGLWDYLIHVTPEEILALPDLGPDQSTDDFPELPQEARWLIGFWINRGSPTPCKTPSTWMKSGIRPNSDWGNTVRRRIADQVQHIRHWTIQQGSYETTPDLEATYFIDPPYLKAGKSYRCSSKDIDFQALGDWCKTRKGQVLVCENGAEGTDWLPFQEFGSIKANESKTGGKKSVEVLWQNHRAPTITDIFGQQGS